MRIGDSVRFVPAAWTRFSGENTLEAYGARQRKVTGVIVGIHKGHLWCRVRYKTHGITQHECFKIIKSLEDQKNANDGNT